MRDWARLLRSRTDEGRFEHSRRVADLARRIAAAHGLDAGRAELAGLLHDFAKGLPGAELRELARQAGANPDTPAVWHGPAAAHLLQRDFGLNDPAVLSAIARHTTGDAAMTALDAVVYVADLASHDVVPGLVDLALRDLHGATLAAMEATLAHLLQRRRRIDLRAIRAWNAMLDRGMLGSGGGPRD